MSSKSLQAEAHRRRQALRAEPRLARDKEGIPLGVTVADRIHDTVVTNRAEKRAALAVAKRYCCEQVRETDEKTGAKRLVWVHTHACPRWEPKKPKAIVPEAA